MRKYVIAAIAASVVGVAGADAVNQELGPQQYQYQDQVRDQPQARAYLSYNFGGDSHRRGLAAPLHYGLRFDYDSRLRQRTAGVVMTPLLQFDHDSRGESLATAGGVPFAAVNLRKNQDGDASGSNTGGGGGSEGGWTFFDWTLLAVGVGGAGFLIYEATKGHNSPNAQSSSTSSSSSSGGGGLLGTGLLGFAEYSSAGYGESRDFEQQHWLDGGTGQMGDLGGK